MQFVTLYGYFVAVAAFFFRKNAVCERLGKLYVKWLDFAVVKVLLLLGCGFILHDSVICAEVVVYLVFDILQLSRRQRRLFVGNRGVIVLIIRNDNARSVAFHFEVVPYKIVAAAV